jgi:hypothetical protein
MEKTSLGGLVGGTSGDALTNRDALKQLLRKEGPFLYFM